MAAYQILIIDAEDKCNAKAEFIFIDSLLIRFVLLILIDNEINYDDK
jgi:hypothetical protein